MSTSLEPSPVSQLLVTLNLNHTHQQMSNKLHKIRKSPYTCSLPYVLVINRHPQDNIHTKDYNINAPNSHMQYEKQILSYKYKKCARY
jgi:hypothetical protein